MMKWPTFCGRSKLLYWSPTAPAKAAPVSTPQNRSISIDSPAPLAPPMGRTTPRSAASASVVGRPASSSA